MMLALIRHGRTAWNDAGRIQGRADVPLSEAGRAQVRGWQLPAALAGFRIVTSPLARAVETAQLLGEPHPTIEPALTEMDWGAWEGETLESLRARPAFVDHSGLDLRPPGGESPRDVQQRVAAWLTRIAADDAGLLAITHKGVIRAALTLATGWPMLGKPPVRLADDAVHRFEVTASGAVRALEWNLPLVDREVPPRGAPIAADRG